MKGDRDREKQRQGGERKRKAQMIDREEQIQRSEDMDREEQRQGGKGDK